MTLFAIVNRQIAEKIELWIIIAAIVSAIATLLSLVTILKRVNIRPYLVLGFIINLN